jgi:hypothetical protein
VTEWITESGTAIGEGNFNSAREGSKLQCLVIQHATCLRVRRVIELEAVIEEITIHLICLDPATNARVRFEHMDLNSVNRELAGGGQTGESGTDDHNLCRAGTHG